MTAASFIVIEIHPRLEAVTSDPFIAALEEAAARRLSVQRPHEAEGATAYRWRESA